jgi:hypothetical protein
MSSFRHMLNNLPPYMCHTFHSSNPHNYLGTNSMSSLLYLQYILSYYLVLLYTLNSIHYPTPHTMYLQCMMYNNLPSQDMSYIMQDHIYLLLLYLHYNSIHSKLLSNLLPLCISHIHPSMILPILSLSHLYR